MAALENAEDFVRKCLPNVGDALKVKDDFFELLKAYKDAARLGARYVYGAHGKKTNVNLCFIKGVAPGP